MTIDCFHIFRFNEGDKNLEIQKRDLELNETKKQFVKVELQAQKRSQQITECKKEIASLQLKIEELERTRNEFREREKKLVRDLVIIEEEVNRRDFVIDKLNGEKCRSEEQLDTADARLVRIVKQMIKQNLVNQVKVYSRRQGFAKS